MLDDYLGAGQEKTDDLFIYKKCSMTPKYFVLYFRSEQILA